MIEVAGSLLLAAIPAAVSAANLLLIWILVRFSTSKPPARLTLIDLLQCDFLRAFGLAVSLSCLLNVLHECSIEPHLWDWLYLTLTWFHQLAKDTFMLYLSFGVIFREAIAQQQQQQH